MDNIDFVLKHTDSLNLTDIQKDEVLVDSNSRKCS